MTMNRLVWADRLKGILIILVVLGHALQHSLGMACEDSHLWNMIYSFHMPAFMAVSGYLAYGAKHRARMFRRFLQLMVPFLVWSLVKFFVNPPYQAVTLVNYLWRPDTSFWFLWVLFWIAVLFQAGDWLAGKMKIKQEVVIGLICAALVAVMLIWNERVLGIQFISFYILFYAAGYYLHKYDKLVTSSSLVLLLLTVVWAVLAWFWRMHGTPAFLDGHGLPQPFTNYSYRFLTALIAVYVLLCAAPRVLDYRQGHDNLLIFCGIWSLGIYVVHLLLMPFICSFFGQYLAPAPQVIVSFVVALFLTLLVVYLLTLTEVTRRVLLGKIPGRARA